MQQKLVSPFLLVGLLSVVRAVGAQSPEPMLAASPPAPAATTAVSTTSPAGADRSSALFTGPDAEPRSTGVRLTIAPEWGYRVFRDHEPSSTNKHYNASGVPGLGFRLELYPIAFVTPGIDVAKDIGITFGYSRAFDLTSRDVDDEAKLDNQEVNTQWYQFNFGARYRILGGRKPIAVGFTLGFQRSVFDFETTLPNRPIPVGRYTLLPAGADVRYSWGPFSIYGDGRFLLPLTVSPYGDRSPSGLRLGGHFSAGAAFAFLRILEVELRADYTMVYVSLASVPGRSDKGGAAIDQYLVFSAGATVYY